MRTSRHADERMQQRAIPPFVVEALLDLGSRTRSYGADVIFLDREARRRFRNRFGDRIWQRIADQFEDVYVVAGDDGRVVTTGIRTKRVIRDRKRLTSTSQNRTGFR